MSVQRKQQYRTLRVRSGRSLILCGRRVTLCDSRHRLRAVTQVLWRIGHGDLDFRKHTVMSTCKGMGGSHAVDVTSRSFQEALRFSNRLCVAQLPQECRFYDVGYLLTSCRPVTCMHKTCRVKRRARKYTRSTQHPPHHRSSSSFGHAACGMAKYTAEALYSRVVLYLWYPV